MVRRQQVLAWLNMLDDVYRENRVWLTDLDAAIGDADHGTNLSRGFAAVTAALKEQQPQDIGAAFKTTAMALIRTVGGASGALYGTFFLKASVPAAGLDGMNAAVLVETVQAGVDGIILRGKAVPQDKTMIDAWLPALDALKQAHTAGETVTEMIRKAAEAAEQGMLATVPLIARKGRASYLGERSSGHQDPGATSTWLMLKTAADVWS